METNTYTQVDHTYDALLGIPSPPMSWMDILVLVITVVLSTGAAIFVGYFLRYQVPILERRRKYSRKVD